MTNQIRFTDGAGYEQYMGVWSRLAGGIFLGWLAPPRGLRWLDVGCGNGAFTDSIAERCAPATMDGIDPSREQIAFARARPRLHAARWYQADAMALPFRDKVFDAAVMPLVIFFVPDPGRGVAEMARVVASGGVVSAYAWDLPGGGFPYHALQEEMRAIGMTVPVPPSPDASNSEVMARLWAEAGLEAIQTRAITVERTFADFEDFWRTVQMAPSVGPALANTTPGQARSLKQRMGERLPLDPTGRITYTARANAVQGIVP